MFLHSVPLFSFIIFRTIERMHLLLKINHIKICMYVQSECFRHTYSRPICETYFFCNRENNSSSNNGRKILRRSFIEKKPATNSQYNVIIFRFPFTFSTQFFDAMHLIYHHMHSNLSTSPLTVLRDS